MNNVADARAHSILYVPCIRYISEGIKGSDAVDISTLYCIHSRLLNLSVQDKHLSIVCLCYASSHVRIAISCVTKPLLIQYV